MLTRSLSIKSDEVGKWSQQEILVLEVAKEVGDENNA
jgi:hypothetical protein